jgi:hypothetical protein
MDARDAAQRKKLSRAEPTTPANPRLPGKSAGATGVGSGDLLGIMAQSSDPG